MREPADYRREARQHFERAQSIADMIPMMPSADRKQAAAEVCDDLRAGLDQCIEMNQRHPETMRHISAHLPAVVDEMEASRG